MLTKWKAKEKIDTLRWFDILILTFILWGIAIKDSTLGYLGLLSQSITAEQAVTFGTSENYQILAKQFILFAVAIFYLVIRKFNFRKLNIHFSIKAVVMGSLIFLGAAITQDIYYKIVDPLANFLPFPQMIGTFFNNETISLLIYSLFNGMYEEIYFLGFCFAVSPKYFKYVIPFSILIRISFHTYQGMASAIGIGTIFGLYMLFVRYKSKDKNLFPFFIGHAWADIFGLSLIPVINYYYKFFSGY
ncbi:CPBP family glutamic-type intramembrane protease [Streptococcus catagoni]|uniref:CPBP family glutamic-type intramembrane protease n=1 Tax=Streptococcus catagoni TaxID=2654874 RepID=UPI001409AFA7|nr:CPBP family glutamic-type intramembrane protease [Streptococcus catagoni]